MENNYTTGQFAKMADITERTIRYYDKIGLLKPSQIAVNGYRKYSEQDFLKLQKIIALKHLGFSIEEIFPLIINESEVNIKDSLAMQIELLKDRIAHLQLMKESLIQISTSIDRKEFQWNKMIELVHLMNREDDIVEQFKNTTNLNVRIALHDKYSINQEGWFSWLYKHIDFSKTNRLLELGCGNGRLWDNNKIDLRNREFFLSDKSEGMMKEVKNKFGKNFNCIVAECENIPFKDIYFDTIVANHVLFYAKDIKTALTEICRTLHLGGLFYCSTYGKGHMKEITELVQEFDSHISLSDIHLYEKFGLENGEEVLKSYFSSVERIDYPDKLLIDDSNILLEYIMSCYGNQNEIIRKNMKSFKTFLSLKIEEKGFIEITKDAGLFICVK